MRVFIGTNLGRTLKRGCAFTILNKCMILFDIASWETYFQAYASTIVDLD